VTLPDFFILGAPKAGTTALHAALATHPQLLMSSVKEPKFFMCGEERPRGQRGPGDAHSAQEWIWRRDRYERLFDGPPGLLRGESTPFYLYDRKAQQRIADLVPNAKLIAIIRDPVDRAYSNWLHLWSDGLEPVGNFVEACGQEDARVAAGWAAFWHYQRLGRYGEQLQSLLTHFSFDQLLILRYRELVDSPTVTLNRICGFLGVDTDLISAVPAENSRGFVADTPRARILARTVRIGAAAGAWAPPQVWRRASAPLIRQLQRGAGPRPPLAVEDRRLLVEQFSPDVALLEQVTGQSFSDWLGDRGRGAYGARVSVDAEITQDSENRTSV
jgi:hypothetical protein